MADSEIERSDEFPDTTNQFALQVGENLPNHTMSALGMGRFIRTGVNGPLVFRTKQSVYRMCAYLMIMAEAHKLADEPGEHTYQEVEEAIQNS